MRDENEFVRHASEPAGDCRVCGKPSWLADETGPVHLCCSRVPEGGRCGACATSETLNRGAGRRTREMAAVRRRQAAQE